MAISPDPTPQATEAVPVDIQAWTVAALQSVELSPLAITSTMEPALSVTSAQDSSAPEAVVSPKLATTTKMVVSLPYRPGGVPRASSWKEWAEDKGTYKGSRHRRRWENDRLAGVPNVQPPMPIDYVVHPTYPIRNNLPYHLATLWDQRDTRSLCLHAEDTAAKRQKAQKRRDRERGHASGDGRGEVPRELREAIKRSPAVWGWVRTLEETMRAFLARQMDGWEHIDDDVSEGAISGDEDEMVVVVPSKMRGPEGKLVFDDELGSGQMGSYKRWLVHAIADYYGLNSYSATVGSGSNSKRVVYVEGSAKVPGSPVRRLSMSSVDVCLPRPLWEACQGK